MIEELEERKEKEELLEGTYDCVFKGLMLDPNNPDYIMGFIHMITGVPYEVLQHLKIENAEYTVNNKKEKKMRSDIIVSVGNRYINFEIDRIGRESTYI